MARENLNWRSFVDPGAIAARWKPAGTPTFYLIDHRGVIRYKWAGAPGEKVMDAALAKVIAEAEGAGKTLRQKWNHLDQHWADEKTGVEFAAPVARAFGVSGVPEAVLIGAGGRILWRGHPSGKAGGRSFESRINDALKK